MNIKELYRYGRDRLNYNSYSPSLDASILLNKATGFDRLSIYLKPSITINDEKIENYKSLINRRLSNEPIAYIVGEKEFYSLTFKVNKNVLIPRPETEILVSEAYKILNTLEYPLFCDIGTGCGCIAISIKTQIKKSKCIASDISCSALQLAKENAISNGVDIQFVLGDSLRYIKNDCIDLVVSNPPYIGKDEYLFLENDIKNYEPEEALIAKNNGLSIIKKVMNESKNVLKKSGWCLVEIGNKQSDYVIDLFKQNGYKYITAVEDLAGIKRVIKAKWTN